MGWSLCCYFVLHWLVCLYVVKLCFIGWLICFSLHLIGWLVLRLLNCAWLVGWLICMLICVRLGICCWIVLDGLIGLRVGNWNCTVFHTTADWWTIRKMCLFKKNFFYPSQFTTFFLPPPPPPGCCDWFCPTGILLQFFDFPLCVNHVCIVASCFAVNELQRYRTKGGTRVLIGMLLASRQF